ncbi:MAG: class I SAM-dependent methyltransferase [Planifilum fulgidum]|uniref:class I SAM-dependent methyltransferase n=1 Tax=Planifilum fulgidum TaxID=201973 RepID=UPI0015A6FEAC|nr:class I SAM-dependent methyltransferase [Planifilum fulgidum]
MPSIGTGRIWKATRSAPVSWICPFLLGRRLRPHAAVLDLGIGSGKVEERLLPLRPNVRVVGVDASAAMLSLAKQRLKEAQFRLIRHDLNDIESLSLPSAPLQAVIIVQTLHHLPHPKQREVYRFVHRHLEPGGLFLFMDRVRLPAAPTCGNGSSSKRNTRAEKAGNNS